MALLAFAVTSALAFKAPFAVLGNAETRSLIRVWAPQPLDNVPQGSVFTSASKDNMKRFVQARLMLEDRSTGCFFSCGDSLTLILCKFDATGHTITLPLWNPGESKPPASLFKELRGWHDERLGHKQLTAKLAWPEDREAWREAFSP